MWCCVIPAKSAAISWLRSNLVVKRDAVLRESRLLYGDSEMVQEMKEGVTRRSRGMQNEILEREIEQKEALGSSSALSLARLGFSSSSSAKTNARLASDCVVEGFSRSSCFTS